VDESDRSDWWLKLGKDLLSRGQFHAALRAFESARSLNRDNGEILDLVQKAQRSEEEERQTLLAGPRIDWSPPRPKLPEELNCLYRIEAVENLQSVLRHGVLSRNEVVRRQLQFTDVSWQSVQSRRRSRRIGRRNVHDYVPLFFCWDTPMNAVLRRDSGIIIIEVSREVLFKPGVLVAEGNIADSMTADPLPALDGLQRLDWNVIRQDFGKRTMADFEEWKRRKSAEALIPDVVEPDYFLGILDGNGDRISGG
jgi:hypothetical protein